MTTTATHTITFCLGARRWDLTTGEKVAGGQLLYSSTGRTYMFDGRQLVGWKRTQQGIRTYHWAVTNLAEVKATLTPARDRPRPARAPKVTAGVLRRRQLIARGLRARMANPDSSAAERTAYQRQLEEWGMLRTA